MPPRSSISFCSGSRSITGYGVSGSISVEFAPSSPHDVARELGDRDVHAEADAEVRDPALAGDAAGEDLALPAARAEAAGHEHAVDAARARARASSSDMPSASTQRTSTRQPWWMPACLSASCTERYASCSFTYLPTSAISTVLVALARCARSSSAHSPSSAGRRGEPELLADELVEALLLERLRDEVDVGHVAVGDRPRSASTSAKSAILSRMSRESALASSGRRRCPGGYRCGAAR